MQNRPTKEILESIKAMLSKPAGTVSEVGGQGLLLVSDLSPRIEQAERLVAMIDSPAGGVKVEEVRLKNVSASAAIETVMKLA